MGFLTTQKHTLFVTNTKTTQIFLNRKENLNINYIYNNKGYFPFFLLIFGSEKKKKRDSYSMIFFPDNELVLAQTMNQNCQNIF